MNSIAIVILFILIIACAIVWAQFRAKHFYAGAIRPIYFGSHRSKLEERLIAIVEELTGHSFPQGSIRETNRSKDHKTQCVSLELDGYNKDLRIAIEVQGPLHRAQGDNESYERYMRRLAHDKLKKRLCEEQGIILITLEYDILTNRFNQEGARNYIASRLFDAGAISECPREYTPAQTNVVPWTRENK